MYFRCDRPTETKFVYIKSQNSYQSYLIYLFCFSRVITIVINYINSSTCFNAWFFIATDVFRLRSGATAPSERMPNTWHHRTCKSDYSRITKSAGFDDVKRLENTIKFSSAIFEYFSVDMSLFSVSQVEELLSTFCR